MSHGKNNLQSRKVAKMVNPSAHAATTLKQGATHPPSGITKSWHVVIEKNGSLQDGGDEKTIRIKVEVKSLKDLIAHFDEVGWV